MSKLNSRVKKGPTSIAGLSNRRRFSARARLWALIFAGLLAPATIQAVAETASIASATPYDDQKAYPTPGSKVRFVEEDDQGVLRGAIFANAWYINPGTKPKFYPSSTGWVKEGPTIFLANADDTSGEIEANPPWHEEGAYTGGNVVLYESVCYRAKWWTRGDAPTSAGSPWEVVDCGASEAVVDPNQIPSDETASDGSSDGKTGESGGSTDANESDQSDSGAGGGSGQAPEEQKEPGEDSGEPPAPSDAIPQWAAEGVYIARSIVQHNGACYKANWWTQGDQPVPAEELSNVWDSPWEEVTPCPDKAIAPPSSGSGSGAGGSGAIDKMPEPIVSETGEDDDASSAATNEAGEKTDDLVTPVVPPVVPAPPSEPSSTKAPEAPTALPAEGYEFLRQVTKEHWDWMFPLRSGRYFSAETGGGTRNTEPFANPDGTTDTFDLNAFIRATLAYNAWAEVNGYKQFLNRGSIKQ